VNVTRNSEELQLGASPRASIDMLKAARAKAYMSGRDYVIPDDVKEIAIPVLSHRLIMSPSSRMEGKSMEEVLNRLLNKVVIPVI
jgi:MoxR-like ATPase